MKHDGYIEETHLLTKHNRKDTIIHEYETFYKSLKHDGCALEAPSLIIKTYAKQVIIMTFYLKSIDSQEPRYEMIVEDRDTTSYVHDIKLLNVPNCPCDTIK